MFSSFSDEEIYDFADESLRTHLRWGEQPEEIRRAADDASPPPRGPNSKTMRRFENDRRLVLSACDDYYGECQDRFRWWSFRMPVRHFAELSRALTAFADLHGIYCTHAITDLADTAAECIQLYPRSEIDDAKCRVLEELFTEAKKDLRRIADYARIRLDAEGELTVEDQLSGQPLKLYRFLSNRKHPTAFQTLAEESELWRSDDSPSNETIERALKRLQTSLNAIESPPPPSVNISRNDRRVNLDWPADK